MPVTPLRVPADGDVMIPASHRGLFIAIGNFDGVHRGHQLLIAEAQAAASALGTKTGVLTFEPHPRAVLRPEALTIRLGTAATRARVLGAIGVDAIVELEFDAARATISPESFVRDFLVGRLAMAGVMVGEDFRFGHKRAGDIALLNRLGTELGFSVHAIAKLRRSDGEEFSSTRIRDALAEGAIESANQMLGYRWRTAGPVIHGEKRGRELGYPTANINLAAASALRQGIYAVKAAWPGEPARPAVASFGVRPTFGTGLMPLLEVHVFDFDGDLYGKEMTVTFLAWLRPEERFDGIDALVTQIDRDAAAARAINATSGPGSAIDAALDQAP